MKFLIIQSSPIKKKVWSYGESLNGDTYIDTMVISKAFFFVYLGGT
jgi:hypothetical protein